MADENAILIIHAKLAEQVKDYDRMTLVMAKVAQLYKAMSEEERNLLSVAYKNMVGKKKSAWITLLEIESKTSDKLQIEQAKLYRLKVEKEIKAISDQILNLLNTCLIPMTGDVESLVLYLTMKGDYYKSIAEISTGKTRDTSVADSQKAYKEAVSKATDLSYSHPLRLGLMLNYSIFQYEILNDANEARGIAKKAFDDAISVLDSLKEDSYKDSTSIMTSLRDKLTEWTSTQD